MEALAAITLLLILLSLGVWVYRLHAENLKVRAEDAKAWRELALKLSEDQRDSNSRLLIRTGIGPAPKAEEKPTAPPPEISHDLSQEEWAAQDEREEIEQKARQALSDPLQAELLEDAARYDPMWAAVRDRYNELKRQIS